MKQTIRYEVIGRAIVCDKSGAERHYLKLLYRGDGTPWWACSPVMEIPVDPASTIKPGDFINLTIEGI